MKSEIEIRRHGERNYQNDNLTEKGKEEVSRFKERIGDFDIVISSNTKRTKETAILLGIKPLIISGPIEYNVNLLKQCKGPKGVFADIEKHRDSFKKIAEIYERFILNTAKEYIGKKILIISHGMLMILLLCRLDQDWTRDAWKERMIDFLDGIKLEIECNKIVKWKIIRFKTSTKQGLS